MDRQLTTITATTDRYRRSSFLSIYFEFQSTFMELFPRLFSRLAAPYRTPADRHGELLGVLVLTTLFCLGLLLARLLYTGFDWGTLLRPDQLVLNRGRTFLFLGWNLFLAWVPYLISLRLRSRHRGRARYFRLLLWLLFLPNAPYLLTDLLHLHDYHVVPHWYDMMLLLSFAWTGLVLGFASLERVRQLLADWYGASFTRYAVPGILLLSAYGIFLGRFQRWNSWDIVSNPLGLIVDLFGHFTDPLAHISGWGLTLVMSGFLLLGYYTFRSFLRLRG